MTAIFVIGVIVAAVGGWYLFEWLWDRRLFHRGADRFARNLRARAAHDLIENEADLQLLDVRSEERFRQGAIEGAVHIPYESPDFSSQAEAALEKEKPLLIYCSGGFLGRKAIRSLSERGFSRLYHLHRGIGSWKLAGFPISRNQIS